MTFVDAVEIYFRGERSLGYFLVPFGVACAVAAIYFWRAHGGGLGLGLAIPLGIIGLSAAIAGGGLVMQVNKRTDELTSAYEDDAKAPVQSEIERMKKVNANWPRLKMVWAALIFAAVAALLLVKRDWVNGAALALLLACSTAFVVDVFAEKRALEYTAAIDKLSG